MNSGRQNKPTANRNDAKDFRNGSDLKVDAVGTIHQIRLPKTVSNSVES